MTVVLVPVVARYGTDAVFTVGVVAGVLVVIAAMLRLGRYVAFIPWPVIEGFTLVIAVIIFLQQVPAALGVAKPEGENTAMIAARATGHVTTAVTPKVLGLVVLVALIMLLGPRLRRSLPVSLIAVAAATAVAELTNLRSAASGHCRRRCRSPRCRR